MKPLSAAETTALAQMAVSFRNLVWLTVKDRTTGALVPYGFWDDVGTRTFSVIDALSGTTVNRSFVGAGSLLAVDDVVATAELAVRELTVRFSGIDATVAAAVRGYDARLAPIQVYRQLLNPTSGAAVAPARARFVGIVDALRIKDPVRGGLGTVELKVVSQLRELTRANPDMTSDDSQKDRSTSMGKGVDRFYEYANVITKWRIPWGTLSLSALRKQSKKDRDD